MLPNVPVSPGFVKDAILDVAATLAASVEGLILTIGEQAERMKDLSDRYAAGEKLNIPGPHWSQFFDGEVNQKDCRKYMIARLEFELNRLRGER